MYGITIHGIVMVYCLILGCIAKTNYLQRAHKKNNKPNVSGGASRVWLISVEHEEAFKVSTIKMSRFR